MSYLVAIISTVLSLVISLVIGFFLLIALNGFSGKAGDYAVYTYLVWAIGTALIVGIIAFLSATYLVKPWLSVAIKLILPIFLSLILSVISNLIGMFAAVIVADSMWKK